MPYLWFTLLFGITYLPFVGKRLIRIHNDESVYLGQVLEMLQRGELFLQYQFGQPYFHKGPVHYLLVMLGEKVFGLSLTATIYMNLILQLLASLLLLRMAGEILAKNPLRFLVPAMYLFCIPLYFYTFVSQMEVELSFAYVVCIYLLHRASRFANGDSKPLIIVCFWLAAGFAGLIKSPLHSVLLGLTGLTFWLAEGSLLMKLKDWRFYAAAISGIALCVAGFLPAYLSAPESWFESYILHQTLQRKGFIDDPVNFLVTTFFLNLGPWLGPAAVAYFLIFKSGMQRRPLFSSEHLRERHMFHLGACAALVSFLYFFGFGHFAQWYGIPTIAGFILMIVAMWSATGQLVEGKWRVGVGVTAASTLIVSLAFSILFVVRLAEESKWSWLAAPIFSLALSGAAMALVLFSFRDRPCRRLYGTIATHAFLFLSLGSIASGIGETEITELRTMSQDQPGEVGYTNFRSLNFSEWGSLSFAVGRAMTYVGTDDEGMRLLKTGALLVVPDESDLHRLRNKAREVGLTDRLEVSTWSRFAKSMHHFTHRARDVGLQNAETSLLERSFYFVRLRQP